MHVPRATPVATVGPISGVEASLHQFAGLSWHVLMPYTLLGAGLMSYSQLRLVKGQHQLKNDERAIALASKKPKRQA